MCWSADVSLVAAFYGFSVSYYLRHRGYSTRDAWYGVFLCCFTCTQLLDAFFWLSSSTAAGPIDQAPVIPCDANNLWFTRFVVSGVVFAQVPIITLLYPTAANRIWVTPAVKYGYSCLPVLGAGFTAAISKCTYSWQTQNGLLKLPTLIYWGTHTLDGTPGMPSFIMAAGIALWAIAALVFITPWWAATNILLVGGINCILLLVLDGTINLISKLCFYCLLLSLLWLSEPLWAPPSSGAAAAEQQKPRRRGLLYD